MATDGISNGKRKDRERGGHCLAALVRSERENWTHTHIETFCRQSSTYSYDTLTFPRFHASMLPRGCCRGTYDMRLAFHVISRMYLSEE